MSRRFWFVTISSLVHVAGGLAIYISGIWRVEQINYDHQAIATLAVAAPPPPPPAGGGMSLPEQKATRKPPRITKDLVQPPPVKPPEKPAAADTTASTTVGTTPGLIPGIGTPDGVPDGTCLDPDGCGPGPVEKAKPPEKPIEKPPTPVPPNVLAMMRTSGTTQIHPSEVTKNQMDRDGNYNSLAVVKVCVSETGAISSVTLLKPTKYPAYDQRLLEGVRGWRYKPHHTNGQPVKVCGTVTFNYNLAKR